MKINFISKAKITQAGQVTLPLEARNNLKISTNEEIYWYEVDGIMVATKSLLNQEDLKKELKRRLR